MAIAFDVTSSTGPTTDNVLPYVLSWSHTCTGDDRLLVVGIAHISSETVDSVTYNTVAMNLVGTVASTSGQTSLFYLINPASGENTILATMATSFSNGVGMAVSLTGVDQDNPLDGSDTTITENADLVTSNVTTTNDNCWGVDAVQGAGSIFTLTCGQTERQNISQMTSNYCGMSTVGPKTPAGSQDMTWNDDGGAGTPDWAHVMATFKPSSTAATAALTGTITDSIDETDIVTGGKQ